MNEFFSGRTPLHQACIDGNLKVIRSLCEKHAVTDKQDSFGLTPLHYAIKSLNEDAAMLILDQNLQLVDFESKNYIEYTMENCSVKIFSRLLKDITSKFRNEEQKETWLHFSASNGFIEESEILLNEGFDIDEGDALSLTPLHYSIRAAQVPN